MRPLRIATRGSELALAQARFVAARIASVLRRESELLILKTSGDRMPGLRLPGGGLKGLFVKELEEALLDGRADLAVHSAKDLPAQLHAGLALVAFPERADPRDALVARERGATLEALPRGARVGTGSARRIAQLRALRGDLVLLPLRGNVPTRLRRLDEQAFDAVVLACAGLDRLGLSERIDERIDPSRMLPAVAQGTLALEARADDPLAGELAALDAPGAASSIAAERAFLARLQGDCNVPLAALAQPDPGGAIRLRGLVASGDGSRLVRGEACDPEPARAGTAAAEAVLRGGGAAILASFRAESSS